MALGLLNNYTKAAPRRYVGDRSYPNAIPDDPDPGMEAGGVDRAALERGRQDVESYQQDKPTVALARAQQLDADGIDPALVQRQQQAIDAAVVPPAPVEAATDPTAAHVGEDTGGTGVTRARRVETDEHGRPIANTAMTPGALDPSTGQPRVNPATGEPYTELDQMENARKRLQTYQPQKAHGWWAKYGRPLVLGAAAGGRSGNPWGLLGGAIGGEAGGLINPKAQDERWKTNELGEVEGRIGGLREAQKSALQEANARATLAHTQAETAKLKQPATSTRAPHFETDAMGLLRMVGSDGIARYVRDERTGQPVKGKGTTHYGTEYDEATGKTFVTEDGKRTTRLASVPMVNVPGYGPMTPGTKYGADRADTNLSGSIERQNQQAQFENQGITANMNDAIKNKNDAFARREQLEKEGKKFVTNKDGVYTDELTPEWSRYDTLFREYSNKAEAYRAQIKPIVTVPPRPATPAPGGRKYNVGQYLK